MLCQDEKGKQLNAGAVYYVSECHGVKYSPATLGKTDVNALEDLGVC